ncbi:hypothetical protein FY528_00150 [Hymenobacter lutimineralis]|uniref:Uncharacterized protein n=1 Tax=Hymenobacter lutimineralis TaxID=2606448 RepID=A0A5D6VGD8_9BACT|nr:hypothetical protein [Hymenobacter lutimineralis]TYZ14182.1 hypothetical protein FY528_00150 [Hymenobacter lutimineralis]
MFRLSTLAPTSLFLILIAAGCLRKEEVAPASSATAVATSVDATAATEPGVLYTILKDQHYATSNPVRLVSKTKLKFSVKFDNTAAYKTKLTNNQADVNKLYGLSDCNSLHQTNSARFGWRWYQNRLELLAYSYRAGVNTTTLLTAIDRNKWYTCELQITDGKYTFVVNGKKVEHKRSCTGAAKGYQLYPYFGGNETAPQNITLRLQDLP